MKAFFNKWLRRFPKAESGFTLVELLVVVAIIIALAAVIIPSVASFADKGAEGAKAAERENVQTAIDTFMADTGSALVTPRDTIAFSSTDDFSTAGAGLLDLSTYLRSATTTHAYCWSDTGLVTAQDDAPLANCSRVN